VPLDQRDRGSFDEWLHVELELGARPGNLLPALAALLLELSQGQQQQRPTKGEPRSADRRLRRRQGTESNVSGVALSRKT
jgi:hypothetical protein